MTMPIPNKALDQHLIALGKTRSGKSSKVRVMVEYLLSKKLPLCILDPKGDWWGLKSSADGRSPGFPVVIFGGDHADVPINEMSGKYVGELIASGNRPSIIDVSKMRVGERTRFFSDYAEALFLHSRGTRYQVIDECHNFAPQGKILSPQAGEMLHWSNRLASEGQGRGIILLAASQRPQKVHKDFLTSCETLVACRVIHKLDRDAIKDWIDGCADPTIGKEVIASLASMERSDAWVWSPEIEFGPKKIAFPMFETYDSFKPQNQSVGKLRGWADVDLSEVKAKLATVIEEAEANDPKKLRERIRELERNPVTADVTEWKAALERSEEALASERHLAADFRERVLESARTQISVIASAARVAIKEAIDSLRHTLEGVEQVATEAITVAERDAIVSVEHSGGTDGETEEARRASGRGLVSAMSGGGRQALQEPRGGAAPGKGAAPRYAASEAFSAGHAPAPRKASPTGHGGLIQQVRPRASAPSDGRWKALPAVERLEHALRAFGPLTTAELSTLACVRRSGTFDTYLSRMKQAGKLVRGEDGKLSARGFSASDRLIVPQWEDILAATSKIDGRVVDMAELLRAKGPLTRDEIAKGLGIARSGTFDTYLSRLKSAGITENYDNKVGISRIVQEKIR